MKRKPGRKALPKAEKDARGRRLLDLRNACELGQAEAAARTAMRIRGEERSIPRDMLSALENGRIGISGADTQAMLAHAYSLPLPVLAEYVLGHLTLEETLQHRGAVHVDLPGGLVQAVDAHPDRWRASTLLKAARTAHVTGRPKGGWPAFLDHLERDEPVGSPAHAEALAADILARTKRPS